MISNVARKCPRFILGTLILLIAPQGIRSEGERISPVEQALALAIDSELADALILLEEASEDLEPRKSKKETGLYEEWLVLLVDRLYEEGHQELGNSAYAFVLEHLDGSSRVGNGRGLDPDFLEGKLHESNGNDERALEAYLRSAERRRSDSNVTKALERLERKLLRSERVKKLSGKDEVND